MWPLDQEMRRAASAKGSPNREFEVLNNFDNILPQLRVQRLSRECALSRPYAAIVASLHYGSAER